MRSSGSTSERRRYAPGCGRRRRRPTGTQVARRRGRASPAETPMRRHVGRARLSLRRSPVEAYSAVDACSSTASSRAGRSRPSSTGATGARAARGRRASTAPTRCRCQWLWPSVFSNFMRVAGEQSRSAVERADARRSTSRAQDLLDAVRRRPRISSGAGAARCGRGRRSAGAGARSRARAVDLQERPFAAGRRRGRAGRAPAAPGAGAIGEGQAHEGRAREYPARAAASRTGSLTCRRPSSSEPPELLSARWEADLRPSTPRSWGRPRSSARSSARTSSPSRSSTS